MGLLDDELKRRKYCKVCCDGDRGPDMTICQACGVLIVRDREKRRRLGQLNAECLALLDSIEARVRTDEKNFIDGLRARDKKNRAIIVDSAARGFPWPGFDSEGYRVDADGKRIYYPWDENYTEPQK